MAWVRAALVAGTTLAASRLPVDPKQSPGCGPSICARTDELVGPHHVVLPMVSALCLVLFANVPTLLLASQTRVRDLAGATAQLTLLQLALLAVSYAYTLCKSHAYALSCHLALLFLSRPLPPTLLVSRQVFALVRLAAVCVLLAWAWQSGPPLPILDAPALSGCCGSRAHLLAWLLSETLGRVVVLAVEMWRAGLTK